MYDKNLDLCCCCFVFQWETKVSLQNSIPVYLNFHLKQQKQVYNRNKLQSEHWLVFDLFPYQSLLDKQSNSLPSAHNFGIKSNLHWG